jgi:hypothetical protein
MKISRSLVGLSDSVTWAELPSGVAQVFADATVHISVGDAEPVRRVIASASAYTVDLDRVGGVVDTFDRVGGEAFEIAELIFGDDVIFDMLDARDPLGGERIHWDREPERLNTLS